MSRAEIRIALPPWIEHFPARFEPCASPEARMALAIGLARTNVEHRTGGPFGAAVFDLASHRAVAVGVNLVQQTQNAILHAEIVALMLAQTRLGRYTLSAPDLNPHVLVTSCEPCAMCLGALLWSGVRELECGATREDAARIGFDEGPVFPASYAYLAARGVRVRLEVRRADAATVLEDYRGRDGAIYNG